MLQATTCEGMRGAGAHLGILAGESESGVF